MCTAQGPALREEHTGTSRGIRKSVRTNRYCRIPPRHTSPMPPVRNMILAEKQSVAASPPEQPVFPPKSPGSFPPFTKRNLVGKKTE